MKIISGGQTGVDRIGLEAARARGFETGGTAPRGYLTEAGPDYSLRSFGLVEDTSASYLPRTLKNVIDSDGTVLFGDMTSTGSHLTVQYCRSNRKPYLVNPTPAALVWFIRYHRIQVLNVAGNRGSKLGLKRRAYIRQVLDTAFACL